MIEAINELNKIIRELRKKYDHKKFTLDGNLVGDIGEVLVEAAYGIKSYNQNNQTHDGGEISSGKKVQIKSSMGNACYINMHKNPPDYVLSVHINEEGELEELYNGTFSFLKANYINDITGEPVKGNSNGYAKLSGNKLRRINKMVPKDQKIKKVR
ncbi:DUF6998 domain-containing protein [Leeuwenhoekiella sp. W20_SRS_FM14]|uniref:DUF6998 domain-containing protein n=1 Tax=Leeuwenhoekiella sp. W20_SRS_FM14 TaxID=3240270 RepID=UPI003F9C71B9